ncbi:MAG TPA: hypothetical protein VKS82_14370 [Streptosporangiaceae bacterium]|nr:hypothetical protein [Streptosporangiaceae bacterium]
MNNIPGTIYLLHFDRPYRHARHYIGWAVNLNARLAAHEQGRGARLLEVVRAAGIGWQLARTWSGDRNRERQIKRQGGASRCCPLCGVKPRDPRAGLPRNKDGTLSRSRTTDAQKLAAGVMTSAQQAAHTALRPKPSEIRAGKARAAHIDTSIWLTEPALNGA